MEQRAFTAHYSVDWEARTHVKQGIDEIYDAAGKPRCLAFLQRKATDHASETICLDCRASIIWKTMKMSKGGKRLISARS